MTDDEARMLRDIYAQRAKQQPERSHALERRFYGDPANVVRFESEKRRNMDDKELYAYCQQWVSWCWTRKYFIPPASPNILARMQPSKSGQPPDAKMSEEMSFFNMAVHALGDMDSDKAEVECFVHYYGRDNTPIKVLAGRLDISRETYYQYAKKFARKALALAPSLKRAHRESFGIVGTEQD